MYENFVGTWKTVRNGEVSILERCLHGEVRLYMHMTSVVNSPFRASSAASVSMETRSSQKKRG